MFNMLLPVCGTCKRDIIDLFRRGRDLFFIINIGMNIGIPICPLSPAHVSTIPLSASHHSNPLVLPTPWFDTAIDNLIVVADVLLVATAVTQLLAGVGKCAPGAKFSGCLPDVLIPYLTGTLTKTCLSMGSLISEKLPDHLQDHLQDNLQDHF